ncbi:MAG: tRNA (adenosine(37)-N6)-threonylcarbamoyltransferase complex dimerization subunit type 1 TsaB [Lapillicoccus sp.]
MLLLAIDTSTSAISVALRDGSSVLAEATTLDARAHAEHLAPGIQTVLREADAAPADVTDVAVGLGPGPFTGLRVGIVTGRAFALAVDAKVHGLCSLDVLAHQAVARGAVSRGELLVATDARRKEVYWARYAVEPAEPGGIRRLSGPGVARPGDLPTELVALPTVGRGPLLYPQVWGQGPGLVSGLVSGGAWGDEPAYGTGLVDASTLLDVSAAALADLVALRLAGGDPVDDREPLYLRRPDAVPSVSTKSALG